LTYYVKYIKFKIKYHGSNSNSNKELLPQETRKTMIVRFNEDLEELPCDLQDLTLDNCFNQKLENLPNGLQSLVNVSICCGKA